MSLSKLMKLSLLSMGMIFAADAFAQLATIRDRIPTPTSVVVEVKPIPTVLNVVPGVRSVGIGTELIGNTAYTTFIDGYLLDSNLPSRLRSEGREDETPVLQRGQGYSADVGLRYYMSSVTTDSWYGQASLGYALSMSQWGYQGEKVDHTFRSVMPGVAAGYRWIWGNNFLLRVGAGVDGNLVQQNTVTPVVASTAATAEAESDIEGAALAAVMPMVDLGMGYRF